MKCLCEEQKNKYIKYLVYKAFIIWYHMFYDQLELFNTHADIEYVPCLQTTSNRTNDPEFSLNKCDKYVHKSSYIFPFDFGYCLCNDDRYVVI